MIKTIQQAKKIQNKRSASGKQGYAKAVRRFVLRSYPDRYRQVMNDLTVYWAGQDI